MNRILQLSHRTISRSRKIIYRNARNSPYISGDTFAQLCDVSIKKGNKPSITKLRDARSIFCESHYLDEFLEEYNKVLSAKILFAGNSDQEFHNIHFKWPRSVKTIYLQNSFISDSKRIFTLPIGLENKSLGGKNGSSSYRSVPYKFKKNRILLGPYGNTHKVRNLIDRDYKIYSNKKEIKYLSERLSKRRYKKILNDYNLVACPRGNGVDTHRVWESIYYGKHPVIVKDAWSKSLSYLNLPLVYIENWTTSEVVASKFLVVDAFDPNKLESIWETYWQKLIGNA
jgi:hypothetical protein